MKMGDYVNKKGFTLVELLAVLVVLALISLIAIPAVTKVINSAKSDVSDSQMKNIERVLDNYIAANADTLADGDEVCIIDLKKEGLLTNKDIINSKTGEEYKGCFYLSWNNQKNQFDYFYGNDSVVVTLNPNGGEIIYNQSNLIGEIEDTEETINRYIKYSINDGVVTVTGLKNNGFGYTNINVNLEAGKTYYFNCDTNGKWGSDDSANIVSAFLMPDDYINAQHSYYIHIENNNFWEFTPSQTSTYTLRFDVYETNGTYDFYNIGIYEKVESKTVYVGSKYGTLPIPTREGYTFKGWNGKNLVNIADQNVSFTGKHYKEQYFDYELLPNTTYTLSFNYNVISSTNPIYDSVGYGSIVGKYNYDIYHSNRYSGIGRKKTTFTTSNSFNTSPAKIAFRLVRMGTSGNANVDISNIQLEIGSTATPYEPYYITKDTTVVQTGNHTLTAIWEAN